MLSKLLMANRKKCPFENNDVVNTPCPVLVTGVPYLS